MREPITESVEGLGVDGSSALLTVTPLPGMRAWKLLVRLGKLLGASMGGALGGGASASPGASEALSVMQKDVDFGGAISALCDRLSEKEAEEIVRELFLQAVVNDQPVMAQFDYLFMANMPALFTCLKVALKANYGNFSTALAGLKAMAPQARASASKASGIFSGQGGGSSSSK